jgi:hypothetical protein
VLPLRAGLETCKSLRDAVVDTLVVTGLEVQCIVVRVAAPVAAVKRLVTFLKDRGRNGHLFSLGKYYQHIVGQCAGN